MTQLVRLMGPLPAGFDALAAEALSEGHRHMGRLAREWAAAPEQFHALLATFEDDALAGIGGITDEPEPAPEPAWRMRRLYVAKASRGRGVARTIVNALLQEALDNVRLVTAHAGGTEAAQFWEAMGFTPVSGRPWTHEFRG